jgi:hypothetical protein
VVAIEEEEDQVNTLVFDLSELPLLCFVVISISMLNGRRFVIVFGHSRLYFITYEGSPLLNVTFISVAW